MGEGLVEGCPLSALKWVGSALAGWIGDRIVERDYGGLRVKKRASKGKGKDSQLAPSLAAHVRIQQ